MTKHDDWIVGEGLGEPTRWYVIHTAEPRFIAEIFDEDEAPVAGIQWSLSNGQYAANIEFTDEPPTGDALDKLIFQMGEILERYDDQAEERLERQQAEADAEP